MKVLITGGAGYLGGALTDILKDSKHEVRVYDALMFEEDYLKDVPFVLGDIRNRKHLKQHLDWADVVVHLAALVGDGACALNPEISEVVNQECVKWIADNFDGRIIFTSTCSVYGAQDGVLDESSPTGPLSVYGTTKLAAEKHLEGKNAMIFRLGTLFGLSDHYARIRLDLVLNTMTVRAITEGKLKVFGGEQWRPLLHVRDAAQAIATNIDTKHTGVFNIHNANITMLELGKIVKKHVPSTDVEIVDMKFEDLRNYRVSSDKSIKTFGFAPKFSPEQGVKEVKELVANDRIKDPNNPRYTNQGYLEMFSTHKLVDEK